MTGWGKINCRLFVLSSVHLELGVTEAQIALCGPAWLGVRPPTSLCWQESGLCPCICVHGGKDVSCQALSLLCRGWDSSVLTVRAQVTEAEEHVFIPIVSEAYVVMEVGRCTAILQDESELFFWTHILGSSYLVGNSFTNSNKVKLCMAELVKHDTLSSSCWSLPLLCSNTSRAREDSVLTTQFILFFSSNPARRQDSHYQSYSQPGRKAFQSALWVSL